MLGEVGEERSPVLLEELGARLRLGLLHLAVLVEPAHLVAPRAHRVARDVRTEAAVPAEEDVAVEELEVVRPGAVRMAHRLDHRTVAVVALVVPRQVHERDGERLLPGGGEHLPERLHLRVVRRGERLHARRARDGPGVLPEVEVVLPVARGREGAVKDRHGELAELVAAGLRVLRRCHDGEPEPRLLRPNDRAVGLDGDILSVARVGGQGYLYLAPVSTDDAEGVDTHECRQVVGVGHHAYLKYRRCGSR